MKVQVKHYCDMSQNERADYLEDKITARPDKIIPPGAKSYDYLVPIDESNGNPSTEGNTPGRVSWKSTVPSHGVQNFSFFDVMGVVCVGYRGKLRMTSERFETSMMLSGTCDREVIEKIYGGYVEGFWQFKKQGDAYVLLAVKA